jgi:hypothetical protein
MGVLAGSWHIGSASDKKGCLGGCDDRGSGVSLSSTEWE